MQIHVYPDAEALSRAAAELFVKLSRESVQKHGRFTVALSGGSTPKRTHEYLAQAPYRDQVPWEKVHVFWGDERWVPIDDPRSNAKMAYDTLLNHVPVPREQIHPMSGALPPEESARQYETLLKSYFPEKAPRFDLIFLGLGDNGHTASLFPHTSVLYEEARWVKDIFVEEVDMYRITLTAPAINWADNIAFLVGGAGKAQVMHDVLEGEYQPEILPAQLIQPANCEVRWMLDEAASAKITLPKQRG